ncbi:MAG: type 4a pilus biogenesis protein PilO [Candidatus Saccharimonadales bacterium]
MANLGGKLKFSNKHLQIDKANQFAVIAISVSVAIVIFSIVGSMALIKQMKYQNKVISLRSKANKQLVANVKAVEPLVIAYKAFDDAPESVIGTKDKNSKVILDALPSKYDFPALATSLDGLISGSGASVSGITGTDNETQAEQASSNPKATEIPFQISATGNFTTVQKLIADLQRSIRPIQVTSLDISGDSSNLQVNVSAKTYYQPERTLDLKQTVVSNGTTKKTVTKATGSKK